jgi:hypothetical protein
MHMRAWAALPKSEDVIAEIAAFGVLAAHHPLIVFDNKAS